MATTGQGYCVSHVYIITWHNAVARKSARWYCVCALLHHNKFCFSSRRKTAQHKQYLQTFDENTLWNQPGFFPKLEEGKIQQNSFRDKHVDRFELFLKQFVKHPYDVIQAGSQIVKGRAVGNCICNVFVEYNKCCHASNNICVSAVLTVSSTIVETNYTVVKPSRDIIIYNLTLCYTIQCCKWKLISRYAC